MSSGTFGYPLGFATLFAVIGLIVSKVDEPSAPERAVYEEITALYRSHRVPLREKCERFMRSYPQSKGLEVVALIKGEELVLGGNWKEVGQYYRALAAKYPQSGFKDRYAFYLGTATFMEGNDFKQARAQFDKFLTDYPNSAMAETARYYSAMADFLGNDYKRSLAAIDAYFTKFPNGRYAGDMHYRHAFILSSDKKVDQSDKIIRELSDFLAKHPDDFSNGSMLCLLADTYQKKGVLDKALECHKKAVWTKSPDDVIQYALDSATRIMLGNKDWEGIAKLHGEFMSKKPGSQLALGSASWVVKMYSRMGKNAEASEIFAKILKVKIGDPADEQVEFLIDELVKSMVPRKKAADLDVDALDKRLVDMLEKSAGENKNSTVDARISYARARLAQMLKRIDRSDQYLKGIALTNAKTPSALSPALLSVCGNLLLKIGDIAGAEAMFKRLKDHFAAGFDNAGSVGLGKVALVRGNPDEALGIFSRVLGNNPVVADSNEATIGKLQAMLELNQLDEALKLGLAAMGNKVFKGESAGRIYLILGEVYEKKAAAVAGDEAKDFLRRAYGTYQRVYVAYKGFPDLCAEAYWRAHLVAKELGENQIARENLKALAEHPKLQNTEAAEKAKALLDEAGK